MKKNVMIAGVFAFAALAVATLTQISFGKTVSVSDAEARVAEQRSSVIDANAWQVTSTGKRGSKSGGGPSP